MLLELLLLISDILMPIISSVIGGMMALAGVFVTLRTDRKVRMKEEKEKARPYFGIIDDVDTRVIQSDNHVFAFDSDQNFPTKNILFVHIVNSEKVEFMIEKFKINGREYKARSKKIVSKGLACKIMIYDYVDVMIRDAFMYIIDLKNDTRIYKLTIQDRQVIDFKEYM